MSLLFELILEVCDIELWPKNFLQPNFKTLIEVIRNDKRIVTHVGPYLTKSLFLIPNNLFIIA
jgi:hypothetical protein